MTNTRELVELLDHVVARQAVTTKPGAIGTKSGYSSRPPIDLAAMELRDMLAVAGPGAFFELEAEAWERIERPARVPLGLCPCGHPVTCEFDRVAAQCPACDDWLSRADAVTAARRYVTRTWLLPAEIEHETRGWGKPITAGRVRLWRHRGHITPRADGRYLLADILTTLATISPNAT